MTGMRFCKPGRYADAEKQLLAALREAEGFSPQDPRLPISLNNLATLYHDQGRYVDAEPLYRRALVVMEQILGRDNPNVAQILRNLAMLYDAQGRHNDAEPLCRRATEIMRKPRKVECPIDCQTDELLTPEDEHGDRDGLDGGDMDGNDPCRRERPLSAVMASRGFDR